MGARCNQFALSWESNFFLVSFSRCFSQIHRNFLQFFSLPCSDTRSLLERRRSSWICRHCKLFVLRRPFNESDRTKNSCTDLKETHDFCVLPISDAWICENLDICLETSALFQIWQRLYIFLLHCCYVCYYYLRWNAPAYCNGLRAVRRPSQSERVA